MRTLDFAPLYRATVGFDQIADLMDRVLTNEGIQNSYPPYNIEKTDDDAYRISIAVAGFTEIDLNVEVRENALIVTAQKAEDIEGKKFLHRGIATRAFERRFQLADHVNVTGASHADGMLHIELTRKIPEALKPRRKKKSTLMLSTPKQSIDKIFKPGRIAGLTSLKYMTLSPRICAGPTENVW